MVNQKKLIIDAYQHNCSHCGTKGAKYENIEIRKIDETDDNTLHCLFITCAVCKKRSMHLIKNFDCYDYHGGVSQEYGYFRKSNGEALLDKEDIDNLDENIIMSIPTPTFIIDKDIPKKLRDLLIEALKCIKENALTGASACIRKAIYQFLCDEKAIGNNYDEKIKSLKDKWVQLTDYLDVLKGIKGIASDQVHEESVANFTSDEAKMYISILEEIFREVYVIPKQRTERKDSILKKFSDSDKQKKQMTQEQNNA